ncbi:hypothetical protein D1007_27740 [Hordeum vulgare]|nr:hypothetical protein D1007_27740 [Hordeum vulgare]
MDPSRPQGPRQRGIWAGPVTYVFFVHPGLIDVAHITSFPFFFFRMFLFSLWFSMPVVCFTHVSFLFLFFLIFHQFPLFHSLCSLTVTFLFVSTILFFLVSSQVFLVLLFHISFMH